MWNKPDSDLVAQAKQELARLDLCDTERVEAGYVVRMPKAYPVYDEDYQEHVDMLRGWIAENVPNVLPTGRNGMHKYNNQDHSMLTAMLSVENIFGARHDVWTVNVEAEYHEEETATGAKPLSTGSTGRDAPLLPRRALEQTGVRRAG
jgi:hypothetical protein